MQIIHVVCLLPKRVRNTLFSPILSKMKLLPRQKKS